jgi:hypothetical protein
MGAVLEVQVLSPEQVTAREGKRKGVEVTKRLKEVWNEAVGR